MEHCSFSEMLDDVCVRLEDKQITFIVGRLLELGAVLDRLEAELDSLVAESARTGSARQNAGREAPRPAGRSTAV